MGESNTTGKYYYSIGEVAAMFNVNTSMIRYWEKEFDVLRPRKNKKGNRLFTERDVRYVHVIYQLLKVKGYTLAGAKLALKERFSDYEERIIMLETLDKARNFLLDLDKALAEKQKKGLVLLQQIPGLQINPPFFQNLLHVVGQLRGEHHLFACGGVHEAQFLGMQGMARHNLETIVDELLVF